MIPVKEARDIILSRVAVLGTERVELFAALGRVLAEDVIAPFDVPPHKYRVTNMHGESRYLHPINHCVC